MSSVVSPAIGAPEAQALDLRVRRLWWLWLVTGVAWIIASLVILQFDQASVTTVGIIIGCMFLFAGMQQLVLSAAAESWRWLWMIFGFIFLIAGVLCLIQPVNTFAGFADMLGFLLAFVGIWWIVEALVSREGNPLWWLGLASGILMIVAAYWTAGQFFIEKAYTLLVFAGVWALLHGVTDIVRAFGVRSGR